MPYLIANKNINATIHKAHFHQLEHKADPTSMGFECFDTLEKLARAYRYTEGDVFLIDQNSATLTKTFSPEAKYERYYCNRVRIVRKYTLYDLFDCENKDVHLFLLNYPTMHYRLCDSPYDDVRIKLVRECLGCDKVLTKLARDPSPFVRVEVALRFGTTYQDILVHDNNMEVKRELARQGLKLDQFHLSDDIALLQHVARHGFAIDRLIRHEDDSVSATALNYFIQHSTDMEMICRYPGYAVFIRYDYMPRVKTGGVNNRKVLAANGVGLDVLVTDKDPEVRLIARKKRNNPWDKVYVYFLEKFYG